VEFVERKIIFHGSHFVDFYLEQTTKVQEKIEFVFHALLFIFLGVAWNTPD
jgi:NhaP-type Na+/H+ or K+/H+ antiporter